MMPKNILLSDATDLTIWASRRVAQGYLPQLIRKLILSTVDDILTISFRSQEGIHLGGWDGIVEVIKGNPFVPDGISVWEMGTNQNVKEKADSDYFNRSSDPLGIQPSEGTYIFVTPRRWSGKRDWVSEKRRDGIWKGVRAYDADDIESWLQLTPPVHTWFSALIGKFPDEVIDLETYWNDWTSATRPSLSSELIIGGRDNIVKSIHEWINQPPELLSLHSDAQEEALALLAAAISQLPDEQKEIVFARSLIVHDTSAWRWAVATGQNLLLIPLFENVNISQGLQNGHHVFIPSWRGITPAENSIVAPRIQREAAKNAFLAMGFQKSQAENLATVARRSLLSLRRKLAIGANLQQPSWAKPETAHSIMSTMLAGQWTVDKEGDREIIAKLTNKTYEEVERLLSRWAYEPDPPVRHVGDVWFIVSKDDAWSLLSGMLTTNDLDLFRNAVLDVLGTSDPALELPLDKRWQANFLGYSKAHSDLLRRGLADTLAMIGSFGNNHLFADGHSAEEFANELVKRLLTKANEDETGHLWVSLEDVLPQLSEAAPDIFLEELEIGLAGDPSVLGKFFINDKDFDPLFARSPHTGLLWALELLAWSPTYLGHTAKMLSALDTLDPGGRLMNRPINSLREIFLPWHPQTTASKDKRLRVIDTLRELYPNVARRLLIQLLPQPFSSAMNITSPKWRDWKPDEEIRVTYPELFEEAREIGSRLLIDAGVELSRWQELIKNLSSIPAELYDNMINESTAITCTLPTDRHSLRLQLAQESSQDGFGKRKNGDAHPFLGAPLPL